MDRSAVLVAAALSGLLGASVVGASDAPAPPKGGAKSAEPQPASEFLLESTKGERISLYSERAGRAATTVVFLTEDCPVSKLYAPKLTKLAKEYGEQGVVFFAVDSTAGTDRTKAQAFAKASGLDLPLLLDPFQAVATRYDVKQAATSLLLDKNFKVAYRGAIDDQYTLGAQKPNASNEWLVEAIEAVIGNSDVATASTEVSATPLAHAAPPAVTFNEDVAPILHKQCAECHRKGQVGPMELLTYSDAKGYAPQIAEVITQGRMPPWHADPRYGHFNNERRLTDTEKAILLRWADSGAKEGDAKKKPKPPVFKDDGWAMGKPDLIIELPKSEDIPAEGVVDYRYVPVDPQIKDELWVQSVEIRPTAQAVTHHVLALYLPPGKNPMEMFAGLRDGSLVSAGYFGVQVPGCRPNLFPEGTGKKLEPGCKFVFQLHYTPNGKKAQDKTRMGLRFCKTKPKQEIRTLGVFDPRLLIAPNDPHSVSTAKYMFRKPIKLLSMFPHMHMRGAAFRFEKIAGDGADEQRTIVLDVPKYDFNWQNFYLPKDGVDFDVGDTLFCTATYDNSKQNPFNPDPNKSVMWGDQTFEEMMIGYVDYVEKE